jgi:hypothetical protein
MSVVQTYGGRGDNPRTVLVYGNCQAPFVARLLAAVSSFEGDYRFVYAPNHAMPGQEIPRVPADCLQDVALYIEQCETWDSAIRQAVRQTVPAGCPRVSFPSFYFDCLWPFQCLETRGLPVDPAYPFGRYPYGDLIGISIAKQGLRGSEALVAYLEQTSRKMPDLKVRLERCLQWMQAHDQDNPLGIADYIAATFRKEHIFWSNGHASAGLMAELTRRIVRHVQPVLGGSLSQAEADIDAAADFGGMGSQQLPIHPQIAAFFELEYCPPTRLYRWFDQQWTFDEYICRYIAADTNW